MKDEDCPQEEAFNAQHKHPTAAAAAAEETGGPFLRWPPTSSSSNSSYSNSGEIQMQHH